MPSPVCTTNLPWFMDLTFQVPMQYCSLQHWTLLPSPVRSTAGCCFCFGSISSFFLELFLQWSPVAYWAPTNQGSSSFSVLSFCPFILFHGILKARMVTWFGILSSSGPLFVRTLHDDPSVLRGMAHSFIELDKAVVYVVMTLFLRNNTFYWFTTFCLFLYLMKDILCVCANFSYFMKSLLWTFTFKTLYRHMPSFSVNNT